MTRYCLKIYQKKKHSYFFDCIAKVLRSGMDEQPVINKGRINYVQTTGMNSVRQIVALFIKVVILIFSCTLMLLLSGILKCYTCCHCKAAAGPGGEAPASWAKVYKFSRRFFFFFKYHELIKHLGPRGFQGPRIQPTSLGTWGKKL